MVYSRFQPVPSVEMIAMAYDQDIVLNLLGVATVILSIGLILLGRWVRHEMMAKAMVAQVVAMICVIIAAFMVKG